MYARRVLPDRQYRAAANPYQAICRTVASVALNLAFRRYLGARGIRFEVQKLTPFSDPDRYDLLLGGRTCELKPYLISRSSQWQALSDDPQLALRAPALVPLERHTTETVRAGDIYAFGFVGAGVAVQEADAPVQDPPQREYWMHVLPPAWQKARRSAPLGPVFIKAEATQGLSIEVGGRDLIRIAGGQSTSPWAAVSAWNCRNPCWHSITFAPRVRPSGRLGIHAPASRLTHVIEPADWHNVWLAGWGMLLLGWMTRQEFRTRAKLLPQGRRVFQFDRTKTRNLAVMVSDLKPITELPSGAGR